MADAANLETANAADLNAAAIQECISHGWSMKDGSYPIRPANLHGAEDLQRAIRAVGRGGSSHNAIRKHIMNRAASLGMSKMIPANWQADGSIRSVSDLEVERRYTTGLVEVRGTTEDGRHIGGYAAVFNSESRNLGGFIETVNPNAFAKSRGDGWPGVIARYNHDDNMLLGTTAAGTLSLNVDARGLAYDVQPPSSRADVLELVERGDVQKSSFAFRAIEDDWGMTEQGYPLRSLMSAQLVDVAPVNTPAYPDSTAGLRSLAAHVGAELEEVRRYADEGELRKFFIRTDRPSEVREEPEPDTTFGMAALASLRAKPVLPE